MSVNPLILSPELSAPHTGTRARITAAWLRDEAEAMEELLPDASLSPADNEQVLAHAMKLVAGVRSRSDDQGAIESFMHQYDLSSEEGVLLMCVAEALLRVPDKVTADKLIGDKLGDADWKKHLGGSDSMFVNASTWGLMLTGRIVHLAGNTRGNFGGALQRLIGRSGEPMVRMAVRQAMRIMGHQFVMGRTMAEAQKRARSKDNAAYRYSYDMLGEAALTQPDADRYLRAYQDAIVALGKDGPWVDLADAPSISVKLSALHPRYETAKHARVSAELTPRLLALAQMAMQSGIGLTVDAEEAERLELSLDLMEAVFTDPSLEGWNGFGLALQGYQKRAPFVIDWLAETARKAGRRWMVRLVKGAYWDSEIKRAQEDGLAGYPVYTRKANTDVSYLACARRMLDAGSELIYPQFATHNAHTIAAVHHMAAGRPMEFQRLHGMGTELYAQIIGKDQLNIPCRVYAPVGSHEDLLPYLVRRLLENGANTSFVNRVVDDSVPVEELVGDPTELVRSFASKSHPRIPLPRDLYGTQRPNSRGVNLNDDSALHALADQVNQHRGPWHATPLVPGASSSEKPIDVTDPADHRRVIGTQVGADAATVARALDQAEAAYPAWAARPVEERAAMVSRAADLMEERLAQFIALTVREAGKSVPTAISEVREAIDFCRYYAMMSRQLFAEPIVLPGPTGESNELSLHGRGIFVCISPWNFPVAIFLGQVAAALVSGNTVLAKPADQTTLIGHAVVQLLHEAGVPADVLQLVPGRGSVVGAALTADPRVAGVVFTGSTATAQTINRSLAARENAPIATLIAETGGQNALIADSSALPEQLVQDVIDSAFDSAGQRCSAARVLYVQEDIADRVITMLSGAMDELVVGDPGLLSTDVGPAIDTGACAVLAAHAQRMDSEARLIKEVALDPSTAHGSYFAPRAYEISSMDVLDREIFGPVLHVVRWKASELDRVIDQINATGYGLTLGIHSRIDKTVAHIQSRARVGNCYVNRNQIGAVVGVQPFGGEGLSGTGPKAGGPHYLLRFVSERTMTIDTTASGGNASLLTLND